MRRPSFWLTAFAVPTFALLLYGGEPSVVAQQMEHSAPSVPSTQLTIKSNDGKTLTLSPEDLAAMPHKSVSVFNAHSKANETYSGVPLADLLRKAGVPLGESVRGKLFMLGVVASGADNYSVLYSLAEVDPAIHTGDVIVADSLDGQKLGKDGAFKMVSSEERRPARWVRNLTSISVVQVEP
jgi:Oxidoreductase molybdopterin binding domain